MTHPPIWQPRPDQVYPLLGTRPEGLSQLEATHRLERLGPNRLPDPPVRPLVRKLADQVNHPMALLLWLAGLLAFPAGMAELGWAIWGVVVVNAAFSFWQEYRAERALDKLKEVLPQSVRVWRSGQLTELPASELVPGDVVELEEGDRVCADARLVWAEELTLDVSVLTGEAVPVAREAAAAEPRLLQAVRAGQGLQPGEVSPRERVSPAEIRNLVLAGAHVASGRGRAVIFATGSETELGHVAHLATATPRERSTLEVQIEQVVRTVTWLAVGIGLLVFGLTYLVVGLGFLPSLLFAVGIIVANVPEGFLPTVTMSLAMAVQRMAARGALVRRLSALETLSATTVICTDKTGTLTQGRMEVRSVWLPSRGEAPADRLLLTASALCSNARLETGDPTEVALLSAAQRLGLERAELQRCWPRLREIPFDSRRRMMTVVVKANGLWIESVSELALTKGAPLEVLRRCAFWLDEGVQPLNGEAQRQVLEAVQSLADQAFRVLALAVRPGEQLSELAPQALEQDLVLLGLVALYDPPRPEVPAAVRQCHEAGLRIHMVTGDHGRTATAVAAQIGLHAGHVLTGDELDQLSEAQLGTLLKRTPELIFARVLPEHKLRLVKALQRLGEIVAVTGDGVNDAPALSAAHIGIAMGKKGTDVAREAADIVLTDDNFASLVTAIEQGRTVYANIRRFLTYVLSSNVPEMLPFLFMVMLGVPPALTILQVLAVDLGTDMVPALALGTEPPEPGLMTEPPRRASQPLLDRGLLLRAYCFLGMWEGLAAMLGFALVWWANGYDLAGLQAVTPALLEGTAGAEVRFIWAQSTTLALASIVACQVGNVLACRSSGPWWRNRLLWLGIFLELLALLALTHVPSCQQVFRTTSLAGWHWTWLAILPLWMVVVDLLARKLGRKVGS